MDTRPIISPAVWRRRQGIVVLLTLAVAGPLGARELRSPQSPSEPQSAARALRRDRQPDDAMLERAIASVKGANLALCQLAAPTLEWDMGSWTGREPLVDDRFSNDSTADLVEWIRAKHQDPALIDPLYRALSDHDPCVRRLVAPMLGRIGDPRVVQVLVEALGDRQADTRVAAAFALGFTGNQKAVNALLDALADRDPRVRRAAAWAIGKIDG